MNWDFHKLGKSCHVHDWLTVPGGAEEVLKHLHQIAPAPIYCAQYRKEKFPWLEGIDVRSHWISNFPFSKSKHYLYAPILADIYKSIDCRDFDSVICNSHTFAHNIKVHEKSTFFCYYHTVARSVWLPEIDGRAGSGWLRRRIISHIKKLDLAASQHPTYIVANSKTSQARVEKFYRRPVDEVIYPPIDTEKFADVRRESDEEGYLIWGRQIAYKRTDLAIEAAKKAGFRLNVVGSGPLIDQFKQQAERAANIQFHGRLSDADLKQLMSRCRAFLFPGYEDFGMVVVEALAAGLPVLAYSQGGAAESVTDEVGGWIHEQTVESVIDAVDRFEKKRTTHPSSFSPELTRARADQFSIPRFYSQVQNALDLAKERGNHRRFL